VNIRGPINVYVALGTVVFRAPPDVIVIFCSDR